MRYRALTAVAGLCLGMLFLSTLSGCGNPIRRDPANVFPLSKEYDKRVASFKISPEEAYKIAHEAAVTDNKLQFLSKKPTVIVGRWYVFSMPLGSGADLNGYHVNGDNGNVRFETKKRIIKNGK